MPAHLVDLLAPADSSLSGFVVGVEECAARTQHARLEGSAFCACGHKWHAPVRMEEAQDLERIQGEAERAERAEALRIVDAAGALAELHTRALELARDIRWAIMALRASGEASEEGGSPIFSDPEQLRSYLDRL